MIDLDDEAGLGAGDPGGILDAFLSLPRQVAESFGAAGERGGEPIASRSVTFCAMGGSAAAADVVAAVSAEAAAVPVTVRRGYRLPGHVGPEDLVVCVSYSGNTEETVAAYREAGERGSRRVVVSAGGELGSLAGEDGVSSYAVPPGFQPRAALGHLVGGALGAVAAAGVIAPPEEDVVEVRDELGALAEALGPDRPGNEAKGMARWVGDRMPLIWGSEGVSAAAAWRWKCAFNENAKMPAFASALPELDHHEVAGWSAGTGAAFALVVLREPGEHPTVERRLRATLDALGPANLSWREVSARGVTALARILSLMLIGDATSTYHGLARGVDPTPIDAIDSVKSRLSATGAP